MTKRLEQMRRDIVLPYNNQQWLDKVSTMSDEQVLAIHSRFIRDKKLPINQKKAVLQSIATKYTCELCGITYYRDNPDLEECEECGQSWA